MTSTTRRLSGTTALPSFSRLALFGIAGSLAFAGAAQAQDLPTGGSVVGGSARIINTTNKVTIVQASQATALNWDSFNIGQGKFVQFVQPNSNAVALNRVTGNEGSVILGSLTSNGKVFLVNPNGVMFGKGAQVSVGGLVASTRGISNADFMAGRYSFAGSGGGAVLNQGTITAHDGGYVALLGATVSNEGLISARFGTVALSAGNALTLDVAGDGLLSVAVDAGAVNALVRNGGMIRADGGNVLLTAQAAGQLLHTVVNNSGVIEAHTLQNRGGTIRLMGDMASGTINQSGTLDAGAPTGGDGGFIETSAARVNIADSSKISTAAPGGVTGTWLIDPQDFTIGAGGNISGATLSALLVTNSVTISTLPGPDVTTPGTPPVTSLGTSSPGNGDINVNDAIAWTASPSTTTLRMNAVRDVNINAAITATNGNVVACCGRDVNVNAAITTTNGSVLLNAGHNVNVSAAMTTTDGNIALCAGLNILIAGAMTLTRGSTIPSQSLGLQAGLLMIAGAGGTGPGVAGGTLTFAPLTPPVTVTGPNALVNINYNPVSYALPSDFSNHFTLSLGAAIIAHMLVFPKGAKTADGSTATTLNGFNTTAASGAPVGVTLVAGPNAVANFDSAGEGSGIGITYTGYSLAGANAGQYALAGSCCVSTFRTTGVISAAPVVVPPVDVPPVVIPPVDVPPVVVPPVDTPPGTGSTPGATPVPISGTPVGETPIGGAAIVAPAPYSLALVNGGVRLPGGQLQSTQPLVEVPPAPAVVAPTPAGPFIQPLPRAPYAPKQDRN